MPPTTLSAADLTLLRERPPTTTERIASRPVLNVRHVVDQVWSKAKGCFVSQECWVVYDYSFERTPICSTTDPAVLGELIKIESTGGTPGSLRKLITGYDKFHEEVRAKKAKTKTLLTNLEIDL